MRPPPLIIATLPLSCSALQRADPPVYLTTAGDPNIFSAVAGAAERWNADNASSAVAALLGAEDTAATRRACANDGSRLRAYSGACEKYAAGQLPYAELMEALADMRRALRTRALAMRIYDEQKTPAMINRLLLALPTAS